MTKSQRNTAKPTTLKEVAKSAGVSPMTVSNYVNGHHDMMSTEVRDRVAAVVKRLNYRRNTVARSLRQSRNYSIGMIIVDNSPYYLTDGYTTQIVAGVSNHLSEHGYSLILQGVRPADFNNSTLLSSLQTDGLFAMLSGEEAVRNEQFAALTTLGQPLITFMESFETTDTDTCAIMQDEESAGRTIGQHILRFEPRSVVIVVPDLNVWAAVIEREKGMRSALETNLDPRQVRTIRCGEGSYSEVHTALIADIQQHSVPDAILCINDQMAIAAIKAVRSLGHDVPSDVLVTGFNAFGFHQFSDPELTTVRSSAYDMGVRGAKEMLHRLTTAKFESTDIIFPFEFIVSNSTGQPN